MPRENVLHKMKRKGKKRKGWGREKKTEIAERETKVKVDDTVLTRGVRAKETENTEINSRKLGAVRMQIGR